jgi:hypothetical protein
MIPKIDPELVFELVRDELGGFSARCLNARIRAVGADLDSLQENVTAAVAAHYDGRPLPDPKAIHFVMFGENALAGA